MTTMPDPQTLRQQADRLRGLVRYAVRLAYLLLLVLGVLAIRSLIPMIVFYVGSAMLPLCIMYMGLKAQMLEDRADRLVKLRRAGIGDEPEAWTAVEHLQMMLSTLAVAFLYAVVMSFSFLHLGAFSFVLGFVACAASVVLLRRFVRRRRLARYDRDFLQTHGIDPGPLPDEDSD